MRPKHSVLLQSIAKLETLERTVHDGSQTDRRDDKVSKKLKSLKQVSIIFQGGKGYCDISVRK